MVEFPVAPGISYSKPGYVEFFSDAVTNLLQSWTHDESEWVRIQREHTHLLPIHVLLVLLCGLFWTKARNFSARYVFEPIFKRADLDPELNIKVKEMCFNMSVILISWLHTAYLTVYKYDLFNNPMKMIYEWDNSAEPDYHQMLILLYQAGFYVHRTYASWFEDEWRKDSPVLMAHHVFTFALLATGFVYRYYYCAIFILFLHDISDVLLSASKTTNYLINKDTIVWTLLSRFLFASFFISWCLCRLYWFPLLLLHTTINLARVVYMNRFPPMFFFNNFLLMLLLFMHIYWFKFILAAVLKMATSKGAIKDGRDIQKESKTAESSGGDDNKKNE